MASAAELGEALIDCTRYDEIDDVKDLVLNQGASVNYADDFKKTALHTAAANGSIPLCEFLLSQGAQVDPVNESGNTPLHWAALNGHDAVAKLLLKHGANAEARNEAGDTPMTMARRGGHDELGIFLADAFNQAELKRSNPNPAAASPADGGDRKDEDGGDEDDGADDALAEDEVLEVADGDVLSELLPPKSGAQDEEKSADAASKP